MAENYKSEIFSRFPCVDIVCGPGKIGNIGLYIQEALRKGSSVLGVGAGRRKDSIYHTGYYERKPHAYVVISEGCSNFCSYCVVPYVRGRLRHRGWRGIIREVKEAVAGGVVDITLLGQNVNAYQSTVHGPQTTVKFTDLLKKICAIEGLKSVSFVTSHPKDVTVGLFKLMKEVPLIKPYLHMPAQSGSDRMLKAMNRGYSVKKYLSLVDRYRSLVYNGVLSTDIIVGFPGESDADFELTCELAARVRFDSAFIFKYSPRPKTRASLLADDVPLDVKKKRHARLLTLQKEISIAKKNEKT